MKQSNKEKGKITLVFPEQNETEAEMPLKTPKAPDPVVQEVLDNVHLQYKKNVQALLGKLGQHRYISSWDNQGSFVHKGDVIKGSSLLDLDQDVLQTCAPSSLVCWVCVAGFW